jgi:nucleosome binding factor SPN SPT16 subunit
LKDNKADNLPEIIDNLISSTIGPNKKVGMFLKNEQEDGDLSTTLIARLKHCGSNILEMQAFMNKVNKIKIGPEISNLKVAASFTEWSFKKVIKELEESIEGDITIKHKRIASNLEKILDSDKIKSFM